MKEPAHLNLAGQEFRDCPGHSGTVGKYEMQDISLYMCTHAGNLPKHSVSSPSVPTARPTGQEQDEPVELAAVSRHIKEQLL